MIIDIRKTVLKKKFRSFYTTLFFLAIIAVLLVTNIFYNKIAGIDKYEFSIILAGIYILSIIFSVVRNYYYIYYNDESDKLILRFFSLSMFTNKKSAIEIKKRDLAGYQIKKQLFGLRQSLILFQVTKRGTAKYPPVSITALSKNEKKSLLSSLSAYSKNKT